MKTKFDRINLSKDDFEYNYNPRVAVPNAQKYIDDFIDRSKKLHQCSNSSSSISLCF